jgi:hypothetical protein
MPKYRIKETIDKTVARGDILSYMFSPVHTPLELVVLLINKTGYSKKDKVQPG